MWERLYIRKRRTCCLREARFWTEKERAEQRVRDRQNHIEVAVHIPMMQQMMPVEAEEYARAFHCPFFWEMHAPMQVFVRAIVRCAYDADNGDKRQMADEPPNWNCRKRGRQNEYWPIPPRHRNRVHIFRAFQMIWIIRAKNAMVFFCVRLKWIWKAEKRPVHHKPVKWPFHEWNIENA